MSRGSRRARRLLLMQSQPVLGTDELGLEVEDDDELLEPVAVDEGLAPDDAYDLAPPEALIVDEDFPVDAGPIARAADASLDAPPAMRALRDPELDLAAAETVPRAVPAPRGAREPRSADVPSTTSEPIAVVPPITDVAPIAGEATSSGDAPVAEVAPLSEVAPTTAVAPVVAEAASPEPTSAAPAPASKTRKGTPDPDDDPSVMIPFDLEEDAPEPFADDSSVDSPPHVDEPKSADRSTAATPSKPVTPLPPSSGAPRTPAPTMKSLARRTGPSGTPTPAATAPQKTSAAPAAKATPASSPTPAGKTTPAAKTSAATKSTPAVPTTSAGRTPPAAPVAPVAKSAPSTPAAPRSKTPSSPPRAPSRPATVRSPSGILAATSGDDPLTARFAWLAGQRHPPALDEVRRLVADYRSLTWVFTGDGVTQGGRFTRDRKSFTELFSERIRWELKRFQDVVVNTGMDGERVAGLAKRLDWRVLRFRPDVVGVQIGLQDSLAGRAGREPFRTALREVVERIRAEGAIVLLQTPNLFRHKDVPGWGDLPRYVEAIRDVAAATGSPLVDHWAHWEKLSAGRHAVPLLSEDGLHPGRRGHRELARLLFAVLDVLDPHSPMCADD